MFYILFPDHDDPSLTILGSLSWKTRRGREGKALMPRMQCWTQGTAIGPGPRVALGNHMVGGLQGRGDKRLWSTKHFLDPFGRQGPRNLEREQFPGKRGITWKWKATITWKINKISPLLYLESVPRQPCIQITTLAVLRGLSVMQG